MEIQQQVYPAPLHCRSEIADVCIIPNRDFRIDLFRGLSLWLIFLDHIPETYLNNFTPRNLGFSDAAEILVFLSGIASGWIYGEVASQSGLPTATRRVLRRSFEIYLAQVLTVCLLLAEVWFFARRQPELLDHANVAVFFIDPEQTVLHALAMRYSPVNLDPLLLMVILHFGLALIFPVMVFYPSVVLLASAALYWASHLLDWSVPAYPRGEIYFNPLNWQLLYAFGVWWGLCRSKRPLKILYSNVLALLAGMYLIFAFWITLGWQFHVLESYVPSTISRLIYPVDKGNLDILRLLHFLALALLAWRLLPSNFSVLTARFLRPLIRCGEYSLVIYCSSVLLSFAAHALLGIGPNNLLTQTLLSVLGIVIMSGIAAVLARSDGSTTCHPRTI